MKTQVIIYLDVSTSSACRMLYLSTIYEINSLKKTGKITCMLGALKSLHDSFLNTLVKSLALGIFFSLFFFMETCRENIFVTKVSRLRPITPLSRLRVGTGACMFQYLKVCTLIPGF